MEGSRIVTSKHKITHREEILESYTMRLDFQQSRNIRQERSMPHSKRHPRTTPLRPDPRLKDR